MRVDETTIEIAGDPVFFRSAAPPEHGAAPVYLHGLPTSSDIWVPLLERTGGLAPDLRGFGRSAKGGHLDYSIDGYTDFVEQFLADRGAKQIKLVAHGWGTVPGLALAQRDPSRIERIVLISPVPLSAGFKPPRIARMLRTPVLGELAMGATNRMLLARTLRNASAHPDDAWPPERTDAAWSHFDQGTQRAILRVHRCFDPAALTSHGEHLAAITAPTLIVHGQQDPWFEPALAGAWTERLPNAQTELIAGAGHWPWLDRPETAELIVEFLSS